MSDEAKIEEAICFARDFLASDVMQNDILASPPSRWELEEMEKALKQAAMAPDTNDYATIKDLISDRQDKGQAVPDYLQNFAFKVATDELKPEAKRGKDKYANFERDYKIWRCIDEVAARFSWGKYDSTGLSEKPNAAKIVSQASGLTEDLVIALYKKRRRQGEK